jgi:hypothetical protein
MKYLSLFILFFWLPLSAAPISQDNVQFANQNSSGVAVVAFGAFPPAGSMINVIGESEAAGVPIQSVDGSGNQNGYNGPGSTVFQWLSSLPGFTTIPVYDYGVSGQSSSGAAAVLSSSSNHGTEYLNGTVVGTIGGVSATPNTNLATGNGNTYWFFTYEGTDDFNSSHTVSTFSTNLLAVYATARGYGHNPIICAVTSQATAICTPAQIEPYNSWLRSQLGVSTGVDILVQNGPAFSNNLDANFYHTDKTHLISAGCHYLAVDIANAILGNNSILPMQTSNSQYARPITVIASNTTAATNNIYVTNSGSLVTVTLPTTAIPGDTVSVIGFGAGGWKLAQNVTQQMFLNSTSTTVGTAGSIASSNAHNTIKVVCISANVGWAVTDSEGTLTVN